MRRKINKVSSEYKIMVIDDDAGVIDSLCVVLKRSGYDLLGFTDPLEAIERLRNEHFDLLILDYIMEPIHGNKVVERIREFNKDIYILLLTGHKDLAPPMETMRTLDIQGYCEKSDRFDQLLLLVESGIKAISFMHAVRSFKDGLNKILEVLPRIYQLKPIENALEDILSEIVYLANSKNAFILVDDTANLNVDNRSIFKGTGKFKVDIEEFMEMFSLNLMEKIGYSRTTKQVVKLEGGIIFPLINEYLHSMGVIYVEGKYIEDSIKLLEIFAGQAAASLNNAFLHLLVNTKNDVLNKTYEQLRKGYMDTIEVLRLTVDAKDIYTRGHSDRVAYYAVEIGKSFGLPEKDLETLRISGIFHDIGKIGTSDDILLKAGKLSKKEFEEIKKHPLKGAHILSAVSMFKDVVPVIRSHHERIDGKGYPDGLNGEDIPFLARIIAVADAFDAMLSDRLYRPKLSLEQAKEQLINGAGTQFDSIIVDRFIKILKNYDRLAGETAASYE